MKVMFLGGHSHGQCKEPPLTHRGVPIDEMIVPVPLSTWLDTAGQPRAFRCQHVSDRYELTRVHGDGRSWWVYVAIGYQPGPHEIAASQP